MKTDPEIFLGIDNCFASKRWTNPMDWMNVIKDLGLVYAEASADTECDPLYMGPEYMHDWIDEVKRCSEKTGVVVKNLSSAMEPMQRLAFHTLMNVSAGVFLMNG